MRIPNANIPTQAARVSSALSAATTVKSSGRSQLLDPRDSYDRQGRQASTQVIDAEYVEFYTPSTKVFAKERQNLDLSLEAAPEQGQATSELNKSGHPSINGYQAISAEPRPLPGSHIDIFA